MYIVSLTATLSSLFKKLKTNLLVRFWGYSKYEKKDAAWIKVFNNESNTMHEINKYISLENIFLSLLNVSQNVL